MLRVKAVGVAAAATVPEGRACIDVFVKEPQLDIIATLETSVGLQLTRGCKQNTHTFTTTQQQGGGAPPTRARRFIWTRRENNMQADHVPIVPEVTKQAERSTLAELGGNSRQLRLIPAANG